MHYNTIDNYFIDTKKYFTRISLYDSLLNIMVNSLSSGGFATTQKVIEAALAAIDEVYMMWRNDPEHNIYNRLPRTKSRRYGNFQHWANLAYDIIEVTRFNIMLSSAQTSGHVQNLTFQVIIS